MVPSMNLWPWSNLTLWDRHVYRYIIVNYYYVILTPRQTKYDWKGRGEGRNLVLNKSHISTDRWVTYTEQQANTCSHWPAIYQLCQVLVCAHVTHQAQITFWYRNMYNQRVTEVKKHKSRSVITKYSEHVQNTDRDHLGCTDTKVSLLSNAECWVHEELGTFHSIWNS